MDSEENKTKLIEKAREQYKKYNIDSLGFMNEDFNITLLEDNIKYKNIIPVIENYKIDKIIFDIEEMTLIYKSIEDTLK